MRRDAVLKLLFAAFLFYLALPYIQEVTSSHGALFWGSWIVFFLLVVGANLGIVLNIKQSSMVGKMRESDVLPKQKLKGRKERGIMM